MATAPSGTPVRERGGCLSLYLILAIVGAVFGLLAVLGTGSVNAQLAAAGQPTIDLPSWYIPAQVVLIVITLVAIYGIFTWKKWGVYVLGATWVLSLIASLAGGQSVVTSLVVLVIEAALLWFVLRGKWALFEG